MDNRRHHRARGQPRCSFCSGPLGGRRFGQAGRVRACRSCSVPVLPRMAADAVLAGGEINGDAAVFGLGVIAGAATVLSAAWELLRFSRRRPGEPPAPAAESGRTRRAA